MNIIKVSNFKDGVIPSMENQNVNSLHGMHFKLKVINFIYNKITVFDAKTKRVHKYNNGVP